MNADEKIVSRFSNHRRTIEIEWDKPTLDRILTQLRGQRQRTSDADSQALIAEAIKIKDNEGEACA